MLVVQLMYIAINTRPEISYAVNQCSRYMTKATKAQYEVLKQILRYLAGVKHLKRELALAGVITLVLVRTTWSLTP